MTLKIAKPRAITSFHQFVDMIADKINKRHEKNKFLSLMITGFPGTGKTVLAMAIAEKVYPDASDILNNMILSPVAWTKVFSSTTKKKLVIIDDAGFGGLSRYAKTSEIQNILNRVDIIRTYYTSVIFTTVGGNLAKHLRRLCRYVLVCDDDDDGKSKCKIYRNIITAEGEIFTKRIGTLVFDPYQDWIVEHKHIYDAYWKYRQSIATGEDSSIKAECDDDMTFQEFAETIREAGVKARTKTLLKAWQLLKEKRKKKCMDKMGLGKGNWK